METAYKDMMTPIKCLDLLAKGGLFLLRFLGDDFLHCIGWEVIHQDVGGNSEEENQEGEHNVDDEYALHPGEDDIHPN